MARKNSLEKMSYSQLTALRTQVDRMMVEKQAAERIALRQKLSDMAKEHGLSLDEVLGKGAAKARAASRSSIVIPRTPRTPGRGGAACRAGWSRRPRAARPRRKIS